MVVFRLDSLWIEEYRQKSKLEEKKSGFFSEPLLLLRLGLPQILSSYIPRDLHSKVKGLKINQRSAGLQLGITKGLPFYHQTPHQSTIASLPIPASCQ